MLKPPLFHFLRELKENNRREWFQANKARYEDEVRAPVLALIEELAPRLERVSPHIVCDRSSFFRIHRDVRFSSDKSPYKTHAAAQFRHEDGKDVHAPGFYLHLEPGSVFGGGGLWRPDNAALQRIRTAIVNHPGRWKAARGSLELGGEALQRPPRGFPADHPHLEDLKRKDFVTMVGFSEEEACRADFAERFADVCVRLRPLMAFLCEALGVTF